MSSILEAADRILRTDGYEAASTNRVARVAGFSVGSLYQYFRDKQSIVGALIDRELMGEAAQLREAIERNLNRGSRELASALFAELLARRVSRVHLHRTLDTYGVELGTPSVLAHCVAAGAPTLAELVQSLAARSLPRSSRSVDARVFVVARLASSASFAMTVDRPPGLAIDSVKDTFAEAVERFLEDAPPSPAATELVVRWAEPALEATPRAEQRACNRREARAALLAAGVEASGLEPRVVLLASLAEVARATAKPTRATGSDELLQEVARFAGALGA